MNRDLIEKYAADGPKLRASIAGLTRDERIAFPVPGTWSIQQIVIHMMDSDLIASDRMKRVAAEDHPTLIGYNETAFANTLFYDQLDPQLACDIFEKNRQLTAEILRRLPDSSFDRAGNHNEYGQVTLAKLLKTYVDHLDHHLKFIRQKRALVEK
jgi:uncharacterized damage-inducible protein DinB